MIENSDKILEVVGRIERKLDNHAARLDQHFLDDALVAHDVRMLMRQKGFIRSSLAALGAGIGAAVLLAVRKLTGHS